MIAEDWAAGTLHAVRDSVATVSQMRVHRRGSLGRTVRLVDCAGDVFFDSWPQSSAGDVPWAFPGPYSWNPDNDPAVFWDGLKYRGVAR